MRYILRVNVLKSAHFSFINIGLVVAVNIAILLQTIHYVNLLQDIMKNESHIYKF